MARGQMRDRARMQLSVKTGPRVAGGYSKEPVFGPWFRCYYDPGDENESRGPGSVRRRRAGARMVTPRRALDGTEIDLSPKGTVEIESRVYGTLTLDITGTPERMRRGSSWQGWIADLGKTNRAAPG